MSNEINGVLCTVKSGTYASPTDILGQGTLSVERTEAPILIDNKSSGEWQQVLDGGFTTKSRNLSVEFDYNDDPAFIALLAAAETGTVGPYVVDMSEYYYEGSFQPSITSETANKNEIVKITVLFTSNGVITRAVPVP
jgi:hypothetical protein